MQKKPRLSHIKLALLTITSTCLMAGEFPLHANGLIYDDATMDTLNTLATQGHQNWLACKATTTFHSLPQADIDFALFAGSNQEIEQIQKDVAAFSLAEIRNMYDANLVHAFQGMPLVIFDDSDRATLLLPWDQLYLDLQPEWHRQVPKKALVFQDSAGKSGDDNLHYLHIIKFNTPFRSVTLPERYNQIVNYVDCMVGTNTIEKGRAKNQQDWFEETETPAIDHFDTMIAFPKPVPDIEWEEKDEAKKATFNEAWDAWAQEKKEYQALLIGQNKAARQALEAAVEEAIDKGRGNFRLEDFAKTYLSKEKALEIMRNRRQIGQCSRDNRPRVYGRRVAQLAAQTGTWEIFLRAHLNVINDYFERVSDGSWAYAGRMTYFKELEYLGIDMTKLTVGLLLRMQNPAENHYFGSCVRLGRALSEATDPDPVIQTLKLGVADTELDGLNRQMLMLTYLAYLGQLPQDEAQWRLWDWMMQTPHLPAYAEPFATSWLE